MDEFVTKIPKGFKKKPNPRIYRACIECGQEGYWYEHHCLYGKNHRMAEYYKLREPMCDICHDRLHNHDPELADKYRLHGQRLFEKVYGHEKYMQIFGVNYL